MAGQLFLFLMQAMDDSFQAQHSRPQPEFRTHRNSTRGCLLAQPAPAQTKGVVNQCLPMIQHISSSPELTLKLPALLSSIICDASAYSCTLAPLTRMAPARRSQKPKQCSSCYFPLHCCMHCRHR
jgi:hypothetical protein